MKWEALKNKCKTEIRMKQSWDLMTSCLGTNPTQHITKTVQDVVEEVCAAIDAWDIRCWESLVRPFPFADKYIGKYNIDLTENGWELIKR